MNLSDLRAAREQRGWSEQKAALRLGVSQSYLSMLETGKRRLTKRVAQRAMTVLGLSPTALPPSSPQPPLDASKLAQVLASLDYPGFAYLRGHRMKANPADVLLAALESSRLEARLVEALPWLLLRYWNMNPDWLVQQAKLRDLQNRLGFVVSLARHMSEKAHPANEERTNWLRELEATLDKSRLVREDTLGTPPRTTSEREWVSANRTEDAKHWNLLTDWRPEYLQYGT